MVANTQRCITYLLKWIKLIKNIPFRILFTVTMYNLPQLILQPITNTNTKKKKKTNKEANE